MNARKPSDDQEKFREAGEQAARVIGDFVSIAGDFSRRLEGDFTRRYRSPDEPAYDEHEVNSEQQEAHARDEKNHQKAKDTLHELSEAAGSAIDAFASGLKAERSTRRNSQHSHDWPEERSGQGPVEWLDQISDLLKQGKAAEFFDRLKDSYEPATNRSTGQPDAHHKSESVNRLSHRQEKLNGLFSDQETLDALTDQQFDELLAFVKSNYQSALQLVSNKKS